MTFIHDAPHIESATLDPLTSDDWELMVRSIPPVPMWSIW
jgi:hypothetical protein